MSTLACLVCRCFSLAGLLAQLVGYLFETRCRFVVTVASLVVFSTSVSTASNLAVSQVDGGGGHAGPNIPPLPNVLLQLVQYFRGQESGGITLTIPQIQGAGASSAYVGTIQRTEGVVTLVVNNGFYMQDTDGDNNPATSDGIFVFARATPGVTVGDRVRLTGTVTEYHAGDAVRTVTELSSISGLTLISHGNTVAATSIKLPLAGVNDLERYEGMLVRFTSPLTVSQNYFLGRYGQLTLSAGRLEKPTNHYPPRSAQAIAAAAANAANVIVLDDAHSRQNPSPVPYIGSDNTVRAGDMVSGLTGVIDFGLITAANPGPSGYRLQPTATPVFSRNNPRTAVPVVVAGNVKVASFNVLNFFTTFTDGTTADGKSGQGCSRGTSVTKSNCRGADNLAEFQRQRAKIVAAMLAIDADVFGLMEIQNNGDVAIANLAAALNAVAGAGTYAVVPKPVAAGSTGVDAIRVGMIYKPARLTLVGGSLSDTDGVNNRPPLAQTFRAANGQRFSLIVNHLKSKGGCPPAGDPDADQGDGQGCFNATRIRQVQRLINTFIPQVQAAANDKDLLVIGDLNAYGAEDPIALLTGAGMVNQIERFIRNSALPYSYVFDGESGYLDHALASPSLSAQVAGVTAWHINADEPSVIDYNTEFKPQDLYSATPFRASDHDPVIVSLNLQQATLSTCRPALRSPAPSAAPGAQRRTMQAVLPVVDSGCQAYTAGERATFLESLNRSDHVQQNPGGLPRQQYESFGPARMSADAGAECAGPYSCAGGDRSATDAGGERAWYLCRKYL